MSRGWILFVTRTSCLVANIGVDLRVCYLLLFRHLPLQIDQLTTTMTTQSTNKDESQIRFDSIPRRREARERTTPGRDIVHSHGYHRTKGSTFHSDRRSRVLLCFAPPVPGEVGKRPRGIGASAFLKRFSRAVVSQEFLAMGNIGGLSHQDRGETLTDSRYQKHI